MQQSAIITTLPPIPQEAMSHAADQKLEYRLAERYVCQLLTFTLSAHNSDACQSQSATILLVQSLV